MTLKVLAPLDGSEVSFRALARGLRLLSGRSGLEVTLFTVVSPGMERAPDEIVEGFDEDEEDEIFPNQASADRMLDRAVEMCRQNDVPNRRQVVVGRLVDTVLTACEGHDLLLMHQLERRQIKETLRGSKTELLARRAGIDVLLMQGD